MRRVGSAVRLVQVFDREREETRVAARERCAEQHRPAGAEDGVGVLDLLRQSSTSLRRVHTRLRHDRDRSRRHVVGDP
jgi:hypothetical protein